MVLATQADADCLVLVSLPGSNLHLPAYGTSRPGYWQWAAHHTAGMTDLSRQAVRCDRYPLCPPHQQILGQSPLPYAGLLACSPNLGHPYRGYTHREEDADLSSAHWISQV